MHKNYSCAEQIDESKKKGEKGKGVEIKRNRVIRCLCAQLWSLTFVFK